MVDMVENKYKGKGCNFDEPGCTNPDLDFDTKDSRIVALLDITLQRNMEGGKSSWMHEAAFWIVFELACN